MDDHRISRCHDGTLIALVMFASHIVDRDPDKRASRRPVWARWVWLVLNSWLYSIEGPPAVSSSEHVFFKECDAMLCSRHELL